jgi:putative nucleotidyltransferase with HDIG domain
MRARVREIVDRVLGADLAWSVSLVVVSVLLLAGQRCGMGLPHFQAGDVATVEVVAPFDLDVVDRELTEQRRAQARAGVPDVYVFDTDREARLSEALASRIRSGREARRRGDSPQVEELPERIRELAVAALNDLAWSEDVEQALAAAVSRALHRPVVGNRALLWSEPAVLVVSVPSGEESVLDDYARVRDLDEARSGVRADVRRALDAPDAAEAALAELAAAYVDANLTYDPEGTRSRRDRAAREVEPIRTRVLRGTVLAREGETVESEDVPALEAARDRTSWRRDPAQILGWLVISTGLAFFLYRYATYHQRNFRKLHHLHALLVAVLLAVLGLAAGLMWLFGQVTTGLPPPYGDLERYVPLVPIGTGAVLIALLANGRIAIVHTAFVAALFGAMNDWSLYAAVWALLVQWGGVYAVTTYRDRFSLLRAGLVAGSVGAVAYVAIEAIRTGFGDPVGALYGAGLAFLGGAVGCGLLVSFTLPILEGMFHVLTEIRLLELSNLDNPLLSQLALKAPGSYNHSLVVGTLAEEGAKAIGANSLFCRVAVFYHDVGKLLKPEYFVENQRGQNPHDRLQPSMSALIIASHVKDGIRVAREAGIPEQIVDIIPQHHGTRLMTYFHERAKSAAGDRGAPVDEQDFRYPGPKPQTREAAIFMLADAIEAAARTVDDPTPNRLREMIRRVANAVSLDGQFDECELTFADLDRLQEAFLRTLVSMYHHRVDYPGFEFNRDGEGVAGAPAAEVAGD